jgi:hypothetical protein
VSGLVVAVPLSFPGSAVAQQAGTANTLGQVAALGQELKRPPAPTGPVPRFRDGTVDLGEGTIHTYRQVFMDGRKHPEELDPTWFGHSVGWWEHDTLVIDTVGYNDKSWFDHVGTPHTERLHTIERWTRIDQGHMRNAVTIDDPGAFSQPFTVTFNATLAPPGDELMEDFCQENNQFGIAGGYPAPR